jgi:8-oxo-dGTP pyrophosphatase MutT (NUDIX family)
MRQPLDPAATGYLRQVRALNPPIGEHLVPWHVGQTRVGWLRADFARRLTDFPEVFAADTQGVHVVGRWADFATRSERLGEVCATLAADGDLPALVGEPYPVTPAGREAALCVVDRAAAAAFGVRSFGQHLNGYVRRGGEWWMWIGRRARDRRIFPGALDQLVAGGLPYGSGLTDNLVKECAEEAGMPVELARRARPVGALSYNRLTERGFRPDVLYCYDLELSEDFEPLNTDGEVEEFLLLPLGEVARLVRETSDFKLNCNLVVIDFLIRHGFIGPESPEYLALVQGLRPPLGPPGAGQRAEGLLGVS